MVVHFQKYSECLNTELVWISDSTVGFRFQTVPISDSVWNPNSKFRFQTLFSVWNPNSKKLKRNLKFWFQTLKKHKKVEKYFKNKQENKGEIQLLFDIFG